jgi:NitT/TauT family transport system substrate-binding protein
MIAAGGHVLVNEASLWPGGRFSTAVLVVSRKYLDAHPATVTGLLQAHIRAETLLTTSPAAARMAVTEKLTTGGTGSPAALLPAFAQVTFTSDPLAATILTEAQHAATAGILAPITSLRGLYDLTELNKLLGASGQHKVNA